MEYMEQKMDEQIEGALHLKRQIFEDPYVVAIFNQIVRIHGMSLPKMFLFKSGEFKVVHNKEIQDSINKLVNLRNDYVKKTYGINL